MSQNHLFTPATFQRVVNIRPVGPDVISKFFLPVNLFVVKNFMFSRPGTVTAMFPDYSVHMLFLIIHAVVFFLNSFIDKLHLSAPRKRGLDAAGDCRSLCLLNLGQNSLNQNPLDLIQGHLIVTPVVKPRGPRRLVIGHLLGHF